MIDYASAVILRISLPSTSKISYQDPFQSICGAKIVVKSAHTTTPWALTKPNAANDVEIGTEQQKRTAHIVASTDFSGLISAMSIMATRLALQV